MIPLRDNIPSRTRPWVNYAIMILTCWIFIQQFRASGHGQDPFAEAYGMVPLRLTHPDTIIRYREPAIERVGRHRVAVERTHDIEPTPFNPWWTLLTCIFLHGGWMHLIGNMWFLYIFGDNVEDRLGHARYLLFYLLCGVAASLTHFVTNFNSPVPTIGASGAIAGVMGAYFWLYPRARVLTLIPLLIIFYTVVVPAPLFLGFWFVIQIFYGMQSFGAAGAEGVAWWAHIGGFMVGMTMAFWLGRRGWLYPAPRMTIRI
ncbi:rhomboid family intramembrane serine protease [bacterium]|nr:rhomboid family intramembrane serine protease [bacterium]